MCIRLCVIQSWLNPLQHDQVCVYKYRVVQEDFEDEVKQNASVTTTVEISCDAGKT